MSGEDDPRAQVFDDEHPGPILESALAHTALSEVVSQPALTFPASATLADVIHQMQKERRSSVLIMENDRLAGIFTERDVLMKVAAQPIDLARTPVSVVDDCRSLHAPGRRKRGVRAEQDGARGIPAHSAG